MDLNLLFGYEGIEQSAEALGNLLGPTGYLALVVHSGSGTPDFSYVLTGSPAGLLSTQPIEENYGGLHLAAGDSVSLTAATSAPGLGVALFDHLPTGIETTSPENELDWTLRPRNLGTLQPDPAFEAGPELPVGVASHQTQWEVCSSAPGRTLVIAFAWSQDDGVAWSGNDTLQLDLGGQILDRAIESGPLVFHGTPTFVEGHLVTVYEGGPVHLRRTVLESWNPSEFPRGVLLFLLPLGGGES